MSGHVQYRPKTHFAWIMPDKEHQRIWDYCGLPEKYQYGCGPFQMKLTAGHDWMSKLQIDGKESRLAFDTPVNNNIAFYFWDSPDRIVVTLRSKYDGHVPGEMALLLIHYWTLLRGWVDTTSWENGLGEFQHMGKLQFPKHQEEAEEMRRQGEIRKQEEAHLARVKGPFDEARTRLRTMVDECAQKEGAAIVDCIKSWITTSAEDEPLDLEKPRTVASGYAHFLGIEEDF